MTDKATLDELAPFHIVIAGKNGTKQTLTLPGSKYIMEMEGNETAGNAATQALSYHKIPVNGDAGATKKGKKVCAPAFGAMDYPTVTNGPAWILGTSLFYEYIIGYNMKTNPPTMTFTSQREQPCGSCSPVTNLAQNVAQAEEHWRPLQVSQPHMPTYMPTGQF